MERVDLPSNDEDLLITLCGALDLQCPATLKLRLRALDVESIILLDYVELRKWIQGRCILHITCLDVEASL